MLSKMPARLMDLNIKENERVQWVMQVALASIRVRILALTEKREQS